MPSPRAAGRGSVNATLRVGRYTEGEILAAVRQTMQLYALMNPDKAVHAHEADIVRSCFDR
jgi:hypothetical protein